MRCQILKLLQWFRDMISIVPSQDSFSEPFHFPNEDELQNMSSEEIFNQIRSSGFKYSDQQKLLKTISNLKQVRQLRIEETLPL